ncbi:phage BR0599 family protein [Campylobacter corcagiensis]|uniref:Phage BR0599 family protein n=1 Tax=Campylobacter corcagiensis TaxID=1448857 RepID=A0A7M1LHF6_9BACT|nr:phage BR0599 family protein [Campylobacter corcagiensis]QKF64549.1 putative phage protein [Campylobacter corcagiensis]QOQ87276.1 phage BR0599 family protein [Campylobacter corcagiensis]
MSELFEFILENEVTYYSSKDSDFTLNNNIYKAASIYTKELSKDSLNDDAVIIASKDIYPINLFKFFNPSVNVYVRILDEKGLQQFVGRIKDVEFSLNDSTASLRLATLGGLMKSKIPTRTYSRNCSFECFDKNCSLNKDDFKITILGSECEIAKDFMSIKSSLIEKKPVGYFTGGYAEFNRQRSYITKSSKDTIFLMFPLGNLDKSSVINCYAGCDKLLSTCKNKFNNGVSFGGFAFVPSKNPITDGY